MPTALDAVVARVKSLRPLDQHPYFAALADGSFEREDFVETQIQFLFAVVFFSRPMAVLAGRIPRPEQRVALLENVGDEHGHGNLRLTHERTFLALLDRLGVSPAEIDRRALWAEVRAFNTVLAGASTLDDTLTGLAALGIIEDLFSTLSGRIGSAIVARGWLSRDAMVHYATHEELDVAHAEGFYAQLREPFARHPRLAYQITQGLELGAYAFLRMYEDLFHARSRRAFREVRGPHSSSDGWYLDE